MDQFLWASLFPHPLFNTVPGKVNMCDKDLYSLCLKLEYRVLAQTVVIMGGVNARAVSFVPQYYEKSRAMTDVLHK